MNEKKSSHVIHVILPKSEKCNTQERQTNKIVKFKGFSSQKTCKTVIFFTNIGKIVKNYIIELISCKLRHLDIIFEVQSCKHLFCVKQNIFLT